MKFISLLLRMVRYRSALILVLSMLMGVAWRSGLVIVDSAIIFGALALCMTYACATSVNDIADFKIDQINLKGHADRPLVTGKAGRKDLIAIAIVASVASLVFGFFINIYAMGIIALILIMNILYSLPPLQISHKAILTPFFLVVGYVVLPYALGVAIVGNYLERVDIVFLSALYFLFLSRINLKDFRDREGDSKHNKPTIILKYGKIATCLLSIVSFVIGNGLLMIVFNEELWLLAIILIYTVVILFVQARLLKAKDKFMELVSIGFGARLGNGLLLTILGILVLRNNYADIYSQLIFSISLLVIYYLNFLNFWQHPDKYQFGSQKLKKHHAVSR